VIATFKESGEGGKNSRHTRRKCQACLCAFQHTYFVDQFGGIWIGVSGVDNTRFFIREYCPALFRVVEHKA
jgi:hypothetical protein